MGIMELVETVRLHKSIILIFSGECKVWGKVGYTSIFVFSKAFKRRTGMNILEVKRTLSTKSIEQINNLYIHLINIVWKSRYEVFKEIATFDESEITSENWKMFINYDK
jgi:AraC-like DNA-binding protein